MSCLLHVTVYFPYKFKKKKQKGKFIGIAMVVWVFCLWFTFFFFWKIPRNLGSIDLKLFKEIEKIEGKYERGKCVTVYLFTVVFFSPQVTTICHHPQSIWAFGSGCGQVNKFPSWIIVPRELESFEVTKKDGDSRSYHIILLTLNGANTLFVNSSWTYFYQAPVHVLLMIRDTYLVN